MKHIISDIEGRLESQVPLLKYIAQDWGQLSLYTHGDRPPVKFPCALVDIQSGQFSNDGNLVQEGLLQIVITVADMTQNVSRKAPVDLTAYEMRIYDIMQDIYKVLQGWSGGTDYSGLVRTSFGRAIRSDGIRMRTMTFTCNWQDRFAQPVIDRRPAATVKVNVARM